MSLPSKTATLLYQKSDGCYYFTFKKSELKKIEKIDWARD